MVARQMEERQLKGRSRCEIPVILRLRLFGRHHVHASDQIAGVDGKGKGMRQPCELFGKGGHEIGSPDMRVRDLHKRERFGLRSGSQTEIQRHPAPGTPPERSGRRMIARDRHPDARVRISRVQPETALRVGVDDLHAVTYRDPGDPGFSSIGHTVAVHIKKHTALSAVPQTDAK
jgi:hypothetical protein